MDVVVHFDGCCSAKRGQGAGAAIVYTPEGVELAHHAVYLESSAEREVTTPIAEYTALITGLHLAHELRATHVRAWGDAELIVRHVDGRYRCRDSKLKPLLEEVHRLQACFESCEVLEFPKAGPKLKRRYSNVAADKLAGEARSRRSSIYNRST